MDVGDVSWPIITVAVTNCCTLAVVIANAYFRIQALRDHNRAVLDAFRQQNRQLDRVEQSAAVVASIAPIVVAGAMQQGAGSGNTTVNVSPAEHKE